jgi:DNA-binding LytR/AlgR family response regulator
MKLLLVEDEPSAMRRLTRLVRAHLGDAALLVSVDGLDTAIDALQGSVFDGVLLDLNLGGTDGFDVMRAAGGTPCVVVSAHVDRSLEAFDHAVIDFVPKPIVPARLGQALGRLTAVGAGPRRRSLVVRTAGLAEIVDCDRVVRIQGADDYAELVTLDGRHLLHDGGLALLEQRLPTHFVRTHRSHIVNMAHAAALVRQETGASIRLGSGELIPISRRRLQMVERRLLEERQLGQAHG